jgi:hypothetical protein
MEPLEDRRLLSITVNTLTDEFDHSISDGDVSLRDAIAAATAADTIEFAVTGTINLKSSLGELVIDKALTITGPGADKLTINAGGGTNGIVGNGDGFRIFTIDDGNDSEMFTVVIAGLTLTGGDPDGPGGAIHNHEDLTITGCSISHNAAEYGGGMYNYIYGQLTVRSSEVVRNSAFGEEGDGGGISNDGLLTVASSTIEGNSAILGGGISDYSGQSTVESSTIADNSAERGGGIYSQSSMQIISSTISANEAQYYGGGVYKDHGLTQILFSTITENTAPEGAGSGVACGGEAMTRTEFYSTIVAGNAHSDVDRFYGSEASSVVSTGFNLIGSGSALDAFTPTTHDIVGVDPLLGPLTDNGGPTKTHALLAGSPAIDAGDPALDSDDYNPPLTNDQRGAPFARIRDGNGDGMAVVDIGAYEFQSNAIIVNTLVDESDGRIDDGDASLRDAIAHATAGQTIEFSVPGTINLKSSLGELVIDKALTITGPGADKLTINAGHGPDHTFNTGDGFRIFTIDDGNNSEMFTVEIAGLTLTGGDPDGPGGAIHNHEDLTITGCAIRQNAAASFGGGIYSDNGQLTVESSTIEGNSADYGGGILNSDGRSTVEASTIKDNSADYGGGILNGHGQLTVEYTTIKDNSVEHYGGGIFSSDGQLIVDCSAIVGNSAERGGGIYSNGEPMSATQIISSTISANEAQHYGGGVYNYHGLTQIQFSTITANTAPEGAGSGVASGSNASTCTEFYSTIVAGNVHSDVDLMIGSGFPSVVSNGCNLIGSGNALGAFTLSDLVDVVDPMLGPLADNGGPTWTHAPLPGSPAIDAGDPEFDPNDYPPMVHDQRGSAFSRLFDGDCNGSARIDIGAYESQPNGALGDYNLDGSVDAADYVLWRKMLGTTVAPPFAGADGDGDSTIDRGDRAMWQTHFGEVLPAPTAAFGGGTTVSLVVARDVTLESVPSNSLEVQPTSERSAFAAHESIPQLDRTVRPRTTLQRHRALSGAAWPIATNEHQLLLALDHALGSIGDDRLQLQPTLDIDQSNWEQEEQLPLEDLFAEVLCVELD